VVWVVFLLVNLFGESLGPILGLDYWLANQIIPFHHIPKILTGGPFQAAPLIVMVALTAVLATLGLLALRRRVSDEKHRQPDDGGGSACAVGIRRFYAHPDLFNWSLAKRRATRRPAGTHSVERIDAGGHPCFRVSPREGASGPGRRVRRNGARLPALRVLARRCAVPVLLDVRVERRLPEPVEIAAYYLVAESLTNTVEYAQASSVEVRVDTAGSADMCELLQVRVVDEGRGGADPGGGSRLVGLRDRVEAIGGRIRVHNRSAGHLHARRTPAPARRPALTVLNNPARRGQRGCSSGRSRGGGRGVCAWAVGRARTRTGGPRGVAGLKSGSVSPTGRLFLVCCIGSEHSGASGCQEAVQPKGRY
jgi:hypothetical protein